MLESLLKISTNFFSGNTVLGEKASEVGQTRGAGSNLCECHLLHWTAATQEEDYYLNLSCLVSFWFCSQVIFRVWMGEWEWTCEWMYDFPMTIICTDSGLWGKMWRAWPPMFVMKTLSGTTCQSHQESAWGATQARKDRQSLCRLLESTVLLVNGGVFVVDVYKLFFEVLS